MHIYLCVRAGARELGRSLARMGVGWGGGGAGAGAGAGAAPWDCLRHAKEPQTETRGTVVWFPGSQMRRGSRAARRQPRSAAGVSALATQPQEGLGLREPKSWDVGRGLKEREGKEPTAPGIPRRSPTQVLTRPDPA